jgi:hypothetical protein
VDIESRSFPPAQTLEKRIATDHTDLTDDTSDRWPSVLSVAIGHVTADRRASLRERIGDRPDLPRPHHALAIVEREHGHQPVRLSTTYSMSPPCRFCTVINW